MGGTESAKRAAVDKAKQLLNKRLKVVLVNGRVLTGDLQCLDKQGNLILGNTCEQLLHVGAGQSSERVMGTVLVPQEQQQSIHALVPLSEKVAMLSLVSI